MYLHIGKEQVLNEKNIIGIFDIKTIKKTDEYEKMYNNMKENIIDISDGCQKTLILISDKKIKGYITNISSITLRKRDF